MFGFIKEKFDNLKNAVSNTAQNLVDNVLSNVDTTDEQYSEFALDDIEDTLISADLGVNYAAELVDNLRAKKTAKPSELKDYLKEEFKKTLSDAGSTELNYKDGELNIYFIAGVNGAGKTTLIAKMAYRFKQEGKKVLIAAGDTFRAAAEEQLNIWSERAGADIVRRDKADHPELNILATIIFDPPIIRETAEGKKPSAVFRLCRRKNPLRRFCRED